MFLFFALGIVTRLAGGGSVGGVASGSIDGAGSAAMFYYPSGVAVSSLGTLYVADHYNNLIRMISPSGTTLLSSRSTLIEHFYGIYINH